MESNVYDAEQENCMRGIGSFQNTHDAGLDEGVIHVKQLASRNSISLARHDPNDIPSILSTVATSVGGLRQELKQLGSSSSGSSTQQLLSTSGFNGAAAGELLDPLHGFSARLSTPVRRNTLGYSEASASRRSSLGYRMQQPAWETSSVMGTVPEGYGMKEMEERIYARMVSALKTVAAQRTATTNSAAGQASEAGTRGSPLPQSRPRELGTAAAADALNAQCQDDPPTASTVAAAMQELAAATGAERLAQQLQERVQQLEQEVQDLKQNVTAHIGSQAAGQQTMQQLQDQRSEMQQQLMLEAHTWQNQSRLQQDQLRQQQDLAAALTVDVRELQQHQQRPPSPVLQQLLTDLRYEAEQQIALMGKQQEERTSVVLDDLKNDLKDELLNRVDGLQLRLQSVEDEQEQLGERQQQQRRSLQQLQASVEQQEREQRRMSNSAASTTAAGASMRQAMSGRQRVCASADGAATPSYAHSDSGAMCALPPVFALPEMASMIPTSISEPDAQHSTRRSSSTHAVPTSILEQQPLRQQASAANSATGLDVSRLLTESQDGRNSQLASDIAELSERVRALEEQQGQAEGMSARLQEVEDQLGAAAPLDAMTCGAVEARLSILEDDSIERKQQVQAAQEQLAEICAQLECLQEQLDSTGPEQQSRQQGATANANTEIAARIASLEAQQQELRDLAQRLEAAQQQHVSGDGSCVSLDSQPSSVKERIQQFEEQLNAAIRRFAPGHLGSRPNSEGGTAGVPGDTPLGGKNPGREASLRELLAALQADVEHLQSKAPSASGDNSATSCCTDASSGSAAAEDAGFVLAGQLQQQLAKLTQNCAELGEAVLQLDLQLQQVEGSVKQQRQQTLTATQSATAATYISKEAAHEIERVVLQVQQLAAAVKTLSSKSTAAEGAAPAAESSAALDAAAALPAAAKDSIRLAEQLELLEDSVQQLKQQVEDSMQQLQAQAELQEQHTAEAKQLAQQLADHHQQAVAASAAQRQQLDSLLAAQHQYDQQQQEQRTAAEGHDQKLAQVSTQYDQQRAAVGSLQQQCAQHDKLLQQLQEGSEAWADMKQQLHQLQELAAGCASADAVQAQETQLSALQEQLQKLSEASADALQQLTQLEETAAAPAAAAEVLEQLSKLQEQLTQQVQQADEQSGLLFSLRVDLQNGLQELGERLQGVEGLREDMEILEDSRKAAAARTEVAAAEALEKVEALMASFAEQQGQQAGSDASRSADIRTELAQLQQEVLGVQHDLTAHMQGAHALVVEQQQLLQNQLETCNQQIQQLQEQQQQLAPVAEQLADLQLQMLDVKQECTEQMQGTQEAATEQQQALRTQLDQYSEQLQQLQEQQQQPSPLAEQLAGVQQQMLDMKQELTAELQSAQAADAEQQQALQKQLEACSQQVQELLMEQQKWAALPEQLADTRQQVLQLQQENTVQVQGVQAATDEQHVALQQQLAACCDQLQQLQEQQQQAQLQAEQLQQQLEQKLSEIEEGLQAQLLSHGSELQQHTSQLQEHKTASEQLIEQAQQANQALAELRSQLDSQQESLAQQQAPLQALQQQLEEVQQQLQSDVSQQLVQLSKQVQGLQDSAAGQAGNQQACSAQLDALQQQLQEAQQQFGEGEAEVQSQLQDAQQERQRLQQQLEALKAEAAQWEQRAAEQLANGLQPLQEQQATITELTQQQEAAIAAQQQQLSQCDQQLQALLAQIAPVQQQQAQQQELLLQQQQQAQATTEQAQLLQQLQSDLSALRQQQQDSAAAADERQHMEQELEQGLQQALAEQLDEVQAQLQQQVGQFEYVQQRLAELSNQAQHLQQQVQERPETASAQQVQQLQGELQDLQQALQQQDKQLQQRLQQQAQELEVRLFEQLQQSEALAQKSQQTASSTAAQHAQQLQQHQERLEHYQQHQDQQRTLLDDLQLSQTHHTSQLQEVTQEQAQQQSVLQDVHAQVQQGSEKLQDLKKQQEKQQQVLSDVQQQQDQGTQQLQQLQDRVYDLGPTVEKAAAYAEAAHSIAAAAEKEVRELRDDLEEALGFMAPFLSPAASSLTSPGATPFVSPHARAAAMGLHEGFPAASHAQSPFGVPAASYSVNPRGAGMPGYSVTIDIGTQLSGRPVGMMPGQQLALQNSLQALQQQQQQQQQGLLEMSGSVAASRRVSAQDSAAALPGVYTPLSAGLWRPEPHQVALDGVPVSAAAAAAEGGSAAAAGESTPAVTAGTGALARFDAQVTPGSSANKLTRCASLDSPSFRAAAMAGVSYGPTPPSHPSTGTRPFRGQLAGSAAKEEGLGVHVTPGGLGSAGRTGGSSAGRLLRTLSLDSPSFVAAATAGMVYDRTPLQSASGAQRAEAGSASRFALSVNASDAALRLFDALGDVGDEGAAAGNYSTAGTAQQQLRLPEEDDSPEHHKQQRLPGGVVASALLRSGSNLQRASPSTAEGMVSQRSSAVWSARDSAVFDNSLYNTPKKRRKSRAADAAGTPGGAVGGTAAAAAVAAGTHGGGSDDASDASSDSGDSHSGLVSLTASLTALQLQRLQQQAGLWGGVAVPPFGESPPITPTAAAGGAVDVSSPATTATPVSVYRNAMYEDDGDRNSREVQLPAGAFSGGVQGAPRALRLSGHSPVGAVTEATAAAAAVTPAGQVHAADTARTSTASSSAADGFVTPAAATARWSGLVAEGSAEDAAAAAVAAGRTLSPAEAVATVRSLAASATPPSLGSWQKKRQQQQQQRRQEQQEPPCIPEQVTDTQQPERVSGDDVAPQSSCNFAAGEGAGDSPVMLPHHGTAWQQQQQETPCLTANRTVARRQALADSPTAQGGSVGQPQPEQPTAVLSAELLQQHAQQQQQDPSSAQLPWLQQQQEAAGTHAAAPLPWHASAAAAAAAATPRAQRVSPSHTPETVLSPMLSELMSLGAEVIDLEGSEADSDLLAVTPDRACSKTGPTGAAAAAAAAALAGAAAEGISKQLTFDEAADGGAGGVGGGGGSEGQERSGSVVMVSLSGQQAADASSVQQQQGSAGDRSNDTTMPQVAAAPAVVGSGAPGSSNAGAVGATAPIEEEPVLRLKGGGGFELHHEHDLAGEDPADWQLGGDDSFDLADYDSSDGEGGSGSDGYWEAWELVQAPGGHNTAAAPSAATSASGGTGTAASAGSAGGDAAAALTAGSAPTLGASSTSGTAGTGLKSAAAAAKRPPIPPGWLRALPIDWQVGAAPPDAYRVALRTSSKSGSGTKTRATVVLTGMGDSIVCEHKLGGGRKRCSYTPGSTVQDWLFLQHSTTRSSSAGGASSSTQSTPVTTAAAAGVGQAHVPGVSQVAVRHDAAGFSGAWLLESVIVQHLKSGDWWQFDNRSGWIKGAQQAKAVTARDADTAAEPQEAGAASSAAKQALWQLQLSASGVTANCPLSHMPRTRNSSGGGAAGPRQRAAVTAPQEKLQQQQQQQTPGTASSSNSSAQVLSSGPGASNTAVPQAVAVAAAAAAAVAGTVVAVDDDASTVSKGELSINCQPGSFVPLDDVELKLRGSPRGSRSRSCSPSPSHRARQQQQQPPSKVQGGVPGSSSAAAAVTAAVSEVASLRSIAAMVSRAAAPAAAATAAAWDALGSRRSSAGELRNPTARRVSGSVAPAKIVPLLASRGSSSSGGASEDGYRAPFGAGGSSSAAAVAVGGGAEKSAPSDAGATGLSCRASRTLTHSSDGTPCRLVRCNSSYLGRTSSSNARQLQEQEQQRGVHFLEWAEQVEFDAAAAQNRRNGPGSSGTSSSSSIQSFTEEQLLEAQGGWEFVRPPDSSSNYTNLIDSQLPTAAGGAGAGSSRAAGTAAGNTSAAAAAAAAATNTSLSAAVGGSGELQEVPLIVAKPGSLLNVAKGGGSEYQLRIHTADKIGAALPAGQHVCVEVLGSTGALLTTQLPRPKGSFVRGSCESFNLSSAAGDIGRIEAVRVWQEPAGGTIGGSWCLHKLEVEAVFRGVTYVFAKSPPECWVAKGAEKAVVLRQPRLLRSHEQAALVAEAAELQRQLDSNTSLEEADKAVLAARLQKLQLRLMTVGTL